MAEVEPTLDLTAPPFDWRFYPPEGGSVLPICAVTSGRHRIPIPKPPDKTLKVYDCCGAFLVTVQEGDPKSHDLRRARSGVLVEHWLYDLPD